MLKKASVLLITMPWDSLTYPSIRLGLLKAVLKRKRFSAKTEYANISFFQYILDAQTRLPDRLRLTLSDYWDIANDRLGFAVGDWLFTQALYENPPWPREKYFSYLREAGTKESYLEKLNEIWLLIKPFLNRCLEKIPWNKYKVIGFTTTFNQNVSSLALAKLIKEACPDRFIVFGGANCEGAMGAALIKRFPWVDAVVRGEGEEIFPKLVAAQLKNEPVPSLPGLCLRKNGSILIENEVPMKFVNINENPVPDYADYFAALARTSFFHQIMPVLFFESSRGCWWGMKSHCTFCGLNGLNISFRSKTPDRVVGEVQELASRYKILCFDAVDNIMDMKYFNTLLPKLQALNLQLEFFFEMKVNLKKQQVQQLRKAGVRRIQGGVESLSTRHLQLLKKGATALQNIQFLKWCLESGVFVNWNFLYAIPGEEPGDYKTLEEVVDYVTHLFPPFLMIPISLDRFSPYFNSPREHGITNIKPQRAYHFLYPWEGEDLFDIAYLFQHDYPFKGNPEEYVSLLREKIMEWRNNFAINLLTYVRGPNFIKIEDYRKNTSPKLIILDEQQSAAYLLCDEAKSEQTLHQELLHRFGKKTMGREVLREFLRDMVTYKVMYEENRRFLSLAVPFNHDFAFASTLKSYFETSSEKERAISLNLN